MTATNTKTQFLYIASLFFIFFLVFNSTFAQTEKPENLPEISTTTLQTTTTTDSTSSTSEDLFFKENVSTTSVENSNTASNTEKQIKEKKTVNHQRLLNNESSLSDSKQKRVINLAANISNRTDAVIVRFTKIIDRLESRIEKMKQQNKDTTVAENNLKNAKTTLASARSNISEIDTLVYNATTSITPRKDWLIVKETFLSTGNLLKQTKTELKAVVTSLKESVDLIIPEVATTSATTTIETQ